MNEHTERLDSTAGRNCADALDNFFPNPIKWEFLESAPLLKLTIQQGDAKQLAELKTTQAELIRILKPAPGKERTKVSLTAEREDRYDSKILHNSYTDGFKKEVFNKNRVTNYFLYVRELDENDIVSLNHEQLRRRFHAFAMESLESNTNSHTDKNGDVSQASKDCMQLLEEFTSNKTWIPDGNNALQSCPDYERSKVEKLKTEVESILTNPTKQSQIFELSIVEKRNDEQYLNAYHLQLAPSAEFIKENSLPGKQDAPEVKKNPLKRQSFNVSLSSHTTKVLEQTKGEKGSEGRY